MMNYAFINQSQEPSWRNYKHYIDQISQKIVSVLNLERNYDFSIILVDADTIQAINLEYRHIDKVTDVISFASQDDLSILTVEPIIELGDIFINVQAIRFQASDYNHSLKREFCFLVTHGILHLLGYDHVLQDDENKMFGLQEVILSEIAKR